MMRVRRLRWIAIAGVAAIAVLTSLVIGAQAFADQDSERCAPPAATAGAATHPDKSWRSGAFRAMGCHAWRRMHSNRHAVVRVSR